MAAEGEDDVHANFINEQLAAGGITLAEAIKGTGLEHKERRELWAKKMRTWVGGESGKFVERPNEPLEDCRPFSRKMSEKRRLLLSEIEAKSKTEDAGEISPRRLKWREKNRMKEKVRVREARETKGGSQEKIEKAEQLIALIGNENDKSNSQQ